MENKNTKPTYTVSVPIKSKDEEKTYWKIIGGAWEKENGITVKLDALPIGNTLFLGKPKQDGNK